MKIKYLGKNEKMSVFGYDFSNCNIPDVTDEKAIAKLQGNAEFEVVDGAAEVAKAGKQDKKKDKSVPVLEMEQPEDFVQPKLGA